MALSTTNRQQFLNSLQPDEVSNLKTAMLPPGIYLNLVNRRLIYSSSLTLDQLATTKSIRSKDGE
jgi:hypothetical protein